MGKIGKDAWAKTSLEKSIELFKMDLWDRLGQPSINDFGGKCISEFPLEQLKMLMLKFKQSQLRNYVDIIESQAIMLGQEFNSADFDCINDLSSPKEALVDNKNL